MHPHKYFVGKLDLSILTINHQSMRFGFFGIGKRCLFYLTALVASFCMGPCQVSFSRKMQARFLSAVVTRNYSVVRNPNFPNIFSKYFPVSRANVVLFLFLSSNHILTIFFFIESYT